VKRLPLTREPDFCVAKRLRERNADYPSVCGVAAATSPDKGRLLFAPLFIFPQ